MKTKGLDKLLKSHKDHCKMLEFSLQGKRYCSCGRDAALQEIEVYREAEQFLRKLDEYLEEHDSVSSNSFAHAELDKLLEKMK